MSRVVLNRPLVLLTAQKAATPLVRKTAREVLSGAQRLAPRGSHLSGSGGRHPGEALVPSLKATLDIGVSFVESTVGSKVDHAASIHQGSQPHIIRGKGKLLKFEWVRGSLLVSRRSGGRKSRRFFFFKHVRHPGNKRPVRYLTTPLALYGRINGFLVTTQGANRSRLP